MAEPSQRARRGRSCVRCGKHPVRSLRSVALELSQLAMTVPEVARVDLPEALKALLASAKSRGAEEYFWGGVEHAVTHEYARSLAAELLGDCVYCAHVMDPERRRALVVAHKESGKGVRRG